jgi:hypothetical protein
MQHVQIPQSRCLAGASRCDITPPAGIYHRMWGAATHDRSTGIHQPLTATAVYLENPAGKAAGEDAKMLVALDHCLLRQEEMNELLDRVSAAAELPRDCLIVFFSHTHAAGLMEYQRQSLPGGELIPAYLEQLAAKVATLVRAARTFKQPATIAYGVGRCSLAANRDYFDEQRRQYVCGYHPEGATDDTVLVARVTGAKDQALATIVNYACHPTTLAWENTLISPDYLGAMRDVVERASAAPCFFIQGASGDLGPRDGFVGEVAVAERNGRQLGYAVLSALEAIPAAGHDYQYAGPVISGATLGIWEQVPVSDERQRELGLWQSHTFVVPLKYRQDLPPQEELLQQRVKWEREEASAKAAGDALRARDARAMVERMTRGLTRVRHLPAGDWFPYHVQLWRMGDAVWIGLGGEHYHVLQRELRARFPAIPIIIGTLANGSEVSYLLDKESYGKGLYQENVSVLAQGCLETLIEAIADKIQPL